MRKSRVAGTYMLLVQDTYEDSETVKCAPWAQEARQHTCV